MSTLAQVPTFTMLPELKYDPNQHGLYVVSCTEPEPGIFVPELVLFHKEDVADHYVDGKTMLERTQHNHNGGLHALEVMEVGQAHFPGEWVDQDLILVFPGHILPIREAHGSPGQNHGVCSLYFSRAAQRWYSEIRRLDSLFDRRCRVVRLGDYQIP
ncbi:MAG: hypothetical protein EXS48_00555 [Candidatus Staskawiczbacteria bacterium]|nr:hypothetical protein [Candidatus Staskawiczbacteria bacterium]